MVREVIGPKDCAGLIEQGVKYLQQAQTFKSSTGEVEDNIRNSEVAWFTDLDFANKLAPIVREMNIHAGWNFDISAVENIQFTKYGPGQYYEWHPDGGSDWPNIYNPAKKNEQGKWVQGRYEVNAEGTDMKYVAGADGYHPLVNWTEEPAPVNDKFDVPTFGWVADKAWWGKVRKLSMTINLSQPDEYEGGNLEIKYNTKEGTQETKVIEEGRKQGTMILFPSFLPHRVSPVKRGTRYSMVIWILGKPFK